MHARTFGRLGAALAGLAVTTMAFAGTATAAGTETISVPDDFSATYSDTRATGHYAVQGTGLRVWTEGATSTDKVAEYIETDTSLADVVDAGEPTLSYSPTSGSIPPGFQLVVDVNGDDIKDGILVGETAYGNDWWLAGGTPTAQAGAPHTGGGFGSGYYGTLAEWSAAFPGANVLAFGFSLGSGVEGNGVINSIEFNATTYTFAVVLASKDECKSGGWTTSTAPVFKNQGDCVSYFASAK